MAAKRANPEHQLQVAACQYLNWSLAGDCEYFAISNNPRSKITGALEKKRGMKAGVGDICIFGLRGGVEPFCGFLEFKSDKGRQTPAQKDWEKRCKECGAEYAVIRSVEQLKEVLEDWGLL